MAGASIVQAGMGYAMDVVHALFDQAPGPIVISQWSGAIVDANEAALELFGYAHGELVGQALDGILPAPLRARRKDGGEVDVEVARRIAGAWIVSFVREVGELRRARIAHDFNNVLSVILARCELLASDEDATAIRTAAETGRSLVGQLVGRKPRAAPWFTSPAHAIEHVARMLRPVLGDQIELVLDLAADAGGIRMDETALHQMLMNLALNARDAMPAGGMLTLTTRRRGDRVELSVADTGIGMTEAVRARIFEPFFTTKGDARGSGLGLATVADIVRQAGGVIDVASEPGQGTTFRLAFPRVETTATPQPPPVREPLVPGGESLLLVDDDELVLRALESLLARSGYRVLATREPDAALAAMRDRAIDALITDVVMPGSSGFAIADALRAIRPAARVLYLSGLGAVPSDRIDDGASFVAKPFSANELLRELRSLLDRN